MKFLCLHGKGTNSQIFEWQTAPLRDQLGYEHDYEFLEGTVPVPPDPSFSGLISQDEECYAYCEESLDSLRNTIQVLEAFIAREGPFDAIMAFSQGAVLATALMIKHAREGLRTTFKLAVFFSAVAFDSSGNGREPNYRDDGEIFNLPTVHVYGSKDFLARHSIELSKLCRRKDREIFCHSGGHEVPQKPDLIPELVRCIQNAMENVHSE